MRELRGANQRGEGHFRPVGGSLGLRWAVAVSLLLLALAWARVPVGHAQVSLLWQTTFNCPEWDQSMGISKSQVNCDGLSGWGSWTTSAGDKEQITSAANYPGGAGGRGQRHWVGPGTNNNSGGLSLSFPSTLSQVWIRWYMRYQAGFTWNPLGYHKWLYFYGSAGNAVPEFFNVGVNIWSEHGSNYSSSAATWNSVMGGAGSDGQWHQYQVHLKEDTNGSNGIGQIWIDGRLVLDVSNAYYGTGSGWASVTLMSNARTAANPSDYYVDVDDISVSTAGYIGVPPAAPTNLRIIR